MATTLTQTSFRIRTDNTAAQGGAPVWAAAQNLNAAVSLNTPFRIRFAISNTGAANTATPVWSLLVSKNGGAYTNVTAVSEIGLVDATNGASPSGQLLTTSLLTGTGTFQGVGQYLTTYAMTTQLNANRYMEIEWGLQFNSPGSDGNKYSFQFHENAGDATTYTHTPSFTVGSNAALAVTEADDVLTGAGKAPNFARLTATEADDILVGGVFITLRGALAAVEANDALIGAASGPVLGALNCFELDDVLTGVALGGRQATLSVIEANDALTGAGVVVPLGGHTATLAAVEANDTFAGLGSVAGYIGVLNAIEAGDILVGSAFIPGGAVLNLVEDSDIVVSKTMLGVNQWLPVPPCAGTWTQVQGCSS